MLTVVNEVTRQANADLDYGGFVVLLVAVLLVVIYVAKDVTMMSGGKFERSLSRALDPILFPLFFVFALNVVTELIDFWS
jgi:hypothetical protein